MQLAEYTVRIIADDRIDAAAARQALDEVSGPAALQRFVSQKIATCTALEKVRAIAVLSAGGASPKMELLAEQVPAKPTTKRGIDAVGVLDLIATAVKQSGDPRIAAVSFDCDNDSGELILTVNDQSGQSEWIIRSRSVEPFE